MNRFLSTAKFLSREEAHAVNDTHESGIQIFVLGPFRMVLNGVESSASDWKSKRALSIFKYLLTRRGAKVSRDVLLEQFWPNEDPTVALGRLYTTMHFLRRALEPTLDRYEQSTFIHAADGQYWFERGEAVRVDSDAFLQLYKQGLAVKEERPDEALRLWEQALALYEGTFLEEDLYEDWTVPTREKLSELFVTTSLQTAQLLVERRGDVAGAIAVCRRAIVHEPYREELYQLLIAYLIDDERHAEAVTQYRIMASMLQDEFGLHPGPKTKALYESIRKSQGIESDRVDHAHAAPAQGPLVCDRPTFDAIHKWALRIQARHRQPLSVLRLVCPDGAGVSQLDRASALFGSLLRASDVVCIDEGRIMIQLAYIDQQGAAIVVRRLERVIEEHSLPAFDIETTVFPWDREAESKRLA